MDLSCSGLFGFQGHDARRTMQMPMYRTISRGGSHGASAAATACHMSPAVAQLDAGCPESRSIGRCPATTGRSMGAADRPQTAAYGDVHKQVVVLSIQNGEYILSDVKK